MYFLARVSKTFVLFTGFPRYGSWRWPFSGAKIFAKFDSILIQFRKVWEDYIERSQKKYLCENSQNLYCCEIP